MSKTESCALEKTSWTADDKVYSYTVNLLLDVRLNWLIIKCGTV